VVTHFFKNKNILLGVWEKVFFIKEKKNGLKKVNPQKKKAPLIEHLIMFTCKMKLKLSSF
jgi:hypothetical protein